MFTLYLTAHLQLQPQMKSPFLVVKNKHEVTEWESWRLRMRTLDTGSSLTCLHHCWYLKKHNIIVINVIKINVFKQNKILEHSNLKISIFLLLNVEIEYPKILDKSYFKLC